MGEGDKDMGDEHIGVDDIISVPCWEIYGVPRCEGDVPYWEMSCVLI